MLTPERRATRELLDDPATDARAVAASSNDIARCNCLFGGTRALLAELVPLWGSLGSHATLLDVGCGVGDLPAAARRSAAAHGVALRVVGLDRREMLVSRAAQRLDAALVADAFAIPLADHSVDIVTACQLMHHFSDAAIPRIARELTRVARQRVIISDLRRSWLAAAGIWIVSWPLGFHAVTRHDGVASVLKGFVPRDLRRLLEHAVARQVRVTVRASFRITASWEPAPA